jgi:hypothetical protein
MNCEISDRDSFAEIANAYLRATEAGKSALHQLSHFVSGSDVRGNDVGLDKILGGHPFSALFFILCGNKTYWASGWVWWCCQLAQRIK